MDNGQSLVQMKRDDLIELVTIKIAERYDHIIQEFCDKSRADIQKTILGHKELERCFESVIKQANVNSRDIEALQTIATKADKLYEVFYQNGFSRRFNQLVDDVHDFVLRVDKRHAAEDALMQERSGQEQTGERKWLRRRDDRFKTATLIVSLVAIVFGSGGIVGILYLLPKIQAALTMLP